MYSEQLVQAGKTPENNYILEHATHQNTQRNHLCGDEIQVFIHLDGLLIKQCTFMGYGCLICMASASIMTQNLQDQTIEYAVGLAHQMCEGHAFDDKNLQALSDVHGVAGRIMCVNLPWLAFLELNLLESSCPMNNPPK